MSHLSSGHSQPETQEAWWSSTQLCWLMRRALTFTRLSASVPELLISIIALPLQPWVTMPQNELCIHSAMLSGRPSFSFTKTALIPGCSTFAAAEPHSCTSLCCGIDALAFVPCLLPTPAQSSLVKALTLPVWVGWAAELSVYFCSFYFPKGSMLGFHVTPSCEHAVSKARSRIVNSIYIVFWIHFLIYSKTRMGKRMRVMWVSQSQSQGDNFGISTQQGIK